MKKLIIDEYKECERIIEDGFTRDISFYELSLLAKYFRSFGLGFPKIREELIGVCKKHLPYFRELAYSDLLDRAIKNCKDNVLKKNVEYVIITKKEVDVIKNLPHKYGKILFFMLVIAKKDKFIQTKTNPTEEMKEHGYFYTCDFDSVLKATKLRINKAEANHLKYFFDGENGYISAILSNKYAWRICFADDNSEPQIVVNDFENILDFFPYFCPECGEQYFDKTSKKHDLCDDCYSVKRKFEVNNNVKKHRNKSM
jgi:hypothetical protein